MQLPFFCPYQQYTVSLHVTGDKHAVPTGTEVKWQLAR